MARNRHLVLNSSPRRIWISLLLILVTTTSSCSAQQKARPVGVPASVTEISIIPKPASIIPANGYFEFSRDTKIIAADAFAVKASTSLNNLLMERYGFTLEVTRDPSSQNSITFSTANADQNQPGAGEGYSLKINPGAIQIIGSERGMFYGVQSLLQLFPADFNGAANLPAVDISDAPRFRYRGMHLDVSRHFMPVDFIKKFIRLISSYKYNYFHWHLTDDQGWRIEIKKYPLLTKIGSKRRETVVGRGRPYVGDNNPVGGFYTQEQIRDIVEYAKARYVTIIPEIELPGHSSAALASYPSLGCCNKKSPYQVQTTWGAFPDIFCPTELTFQFIEDVLTEVISLFPDSPYIHIGGDEVKTACWGNSQEVQDLKQANNLSSDADVQSWFIKDVERFVNSKGKRIIAWDDMVDFGLPPNATVMYWRDSEAARRNTVDARRTVTNAVVAARARHEVIMTPDTYTYFDHPQDDPKREPLSLYSSQIRLEDVYNFEPVPAGLSQEEAKYIIGGQGCIWTELIKEPKDVEYMMFPRALALAEVLWSKRGNRNFAEFSKRLNKEFRNLDRERVNYRLP
jgi:hexosaminidase